MGRRKKEYVEESEKGLVDSIHSDEPMLPAIQEPTALEEITRAEIDCAVATAKKYPRSIKRFRQEALTMATADKTIAGQCFYVLPRADKRIEGPSVRLAEIIASAWGNVRFGARIVSENEKEVVAQGVTHDLEKNVSTTIEVSRRITNKNGLKFSDDMIQVTKNAACSIALRNAIFKVVPKVYTQIIYEQAKKAAVGTLKTLKERVFSMMAKFGDMKVTEEMVLKLVKKPSVEDIDLTDVELLIGVYTAIKDGDTTIKEAFGLSAKSDVSMPQEKEHKREVIVETDAMWEGNAQK